MDINAISQLVGSMGFPIVACCAMFYLYNNIMTSLITTLQKMDKTLDLICEKVSIDKKETED